MAGRGRASSQKRQKEMARLEKRQQKAARKQERKLGPKVESDQDETSQLNQGLDAEPEVDGSSDTSGVV